MLVVRCQRAVFQQWKVDVPWAYAGEVTVANAGDIAKAANLIPANAMKPVTAQGLIVAPAGVGPSFSEPDLAAVRAAAAAIQPSVVRIVTNFKDGSSGDCSGTIIDPNGLILTNAHVVAGAVQVTVRLADGKILPGAVVGHDTLADLAVVRVSASGLPAASRAGAGPLQSGTLVAAVGYTPLLPYPPAVRVGHLLEYSQDTFNQTPISIAVTDTYILGGDSGSPLVNTLGQMVGVQSATSFGDIQGKMRPTTLSISIDSAWPIAQQIISTGRNVVRPYFGAFAFPLNAKAAQQLSRAVGAAVPVGLITVYVSPGSPAEAAGLKPGDIIVSVNGASASSNTSLIGTISRASVGDRLTLGVVGFSDPAHPGASRTVTVTLAPSP